MLIFLHELSVSRHAACANESLHCEGPRGVASDLQPPLLYTSLISTLPWWRDALGFLPSAQQATCSFHCCCALASPSAAQRLIISRAIKLAVKAPPQLGRSRVEEAVQLDACAHQHVSTARADTGKDDPKVTKGAFDSLDWPASDAHSRLSQ